MTIRGFEPASANTSPGEPATAPLFNNPVLARASRPPMTRVSRSLAWILAGLLAAAAALAVAYSGYRQMQPRPLFTPASQSAERAALPARTAGSFRPLS
jgi:hypothetical protein